MGLRIDCKGVKVRNYFRTYRIAWSELNCFADGSGWGESIWALTVQHGSRAFAAIGTATSEPRPDMLAAIRQAAEQHGIPVELTGTASTLPGPKWRPYLPRPRGVARQEPGQPCDGWRNSR